MRQICQIWRFTGRKPLLAYHRRTLCPCGEFCCFCGPLLPDMLRLIVRLHCNRVGTLSWDISAVLWTIATSHAAAVQARLRCVRSPSRFYRVFCEYKYIQTCNTGDWEQIVCCRDDSTCCQDWSNQNGQCCSSGTFCTSGNSQVDCCVNYNAQCSGTCCEEGWDCVNPPGAPGYCCSNVRSGNFRVSSMFLCQGVT